MTLTRDQIQSLPASRETDALVAGLVMGWHWSHDGLGNNVWYDKKGNTGYGNGGVCGMSYKPFNPSADIAAAFRVVEKMVSTYGVQITIVKPYGKIIAFCDYANENNIKADTVPLAICRAALLAAHNTEKTP